MKVCIACGMPMRKKEEFAMGDELKDYCCYCANEDGSMRSYEQAVKGMSAFIVQTQGVDSEVAEKLAVDMLAELPAWKDYQNKN